MVYCQCKRCGCSFPKGHKKYPKCWNCASEDLTFKTVNKKDLSIVDQVIDEMILNKVKAGEIKLP